jgi:hypothetical protein
VDYRRISGILQFQSTGRSPSIAKLAPVSVLGKEVGLISARVQGFLGHLLRPTDVDSRNEKLRA